MAFDTREDWECRKGELVKSREQGGDRKASSDNRAGKRDSVMREGALDSTDGMGA